MRVVLTQANIVILASNHNPGIVSKEWLNQKGIFTETATKFVHTQDFSLIETDNYLLHIDPQRLNIGLKKPNEERLAGLPSIAAQYINALQETPYRAVGLNSNWGVQLESPDVLKGIFITHQTQLDAIFHEGKYDIGAIVMYDYDPFRLQLTIKPDKDNNVRLDFNYHSDVSGIDALSERIRRFDKIIKHAHNIAIKLLGG
jgi:hypothetical protein